MTKLLRVGLITLVVSLAALLGKAAASEETAKDKAGKFTKKFKGDKANLTAYGKNPYFIPLEPGYTLQLAGGGETLTVTVLKETKLVDGVQCAIVEEHEEKDGKVTENSKNYFAIDKTTGDVYYFGEDVGGAWLSGVDGAKFGMMMPGKPKVGDKFYQEIAPKVAMDRCEIVAIDEEVKTPAATFKGCLRVKETTPLEKGVSEKIYAPGVGLIKDGALVLVKIGKKEGCPKAAAKPAACKTSDALKTAPEAVRAAVTKLLSKGEMLEFAMEGDKYEVEYKLKGTVRSASIAPDGKVLEQEETIEISALPKAVVDAVKKVYPKGKIERAETSTKDGKTVYEVGVTVTQEIVVSPDGKVQK